MVIANLLLDADPNYAQKPYLKLSYDHSAGSSLLLEPHVLLLFQKSKFCELVIFSQNSKSKTDYELKTDLQCLVPGMRVDYRMVDFNSLYEPDDIRDVDEEALRLALEELPCCTTNDTGDKLGDPMNLVVIGDFRDIAAAFARRGWLPAEET